MSSCVHGLSILYPNASWQQKYAIKMTITAECKTIFSIDVRCLVNIRVKIFDNTENKGKSQQDEVILV